VAAVLWAVSLALLRRAARRCIAQGAALGRARRPAAAMLLYVVLGRWLAGSGIAAALAGVWSRQGPLASFALVPMGFLSGFVTGSNVGANAALMPVQAPGRGLGLGAAVAPALHNFSGAAGAGMAIAGRPCSVPSGRGHAARPGLAPALALHGVVVTIGTGAMLAWR
jgi:lactate permease